jgi:hypothetical protein
MSFLRVSGPPVGWLSARFIWWIAAGKVVWYSSRQVERKSKDLGRKPGRYQLHQIIEEILKKLRIMPGSSIPIV